MDRHLLQASVALMEGFLVKVLLRVLRLRLLQTLALHPLQDWDCLGKVLAQVIRYMITAIHHCLCRCLFNCGDAIPGTLNCNGSLVDAEDGPIMFAWVGQRSKGHLIWGRATVVHGMWQWRWWVATHTATGLGVPLHDNTPNNHHTYDMSRHATRTPGQHNTLSAIAV